MRIDGISGSDPYSSPDGASSARESSSSDKAISQDGEIRSRSQAYVRAAVAVDQLDQQAIAEAKALLASGQLDTLEAIDKAAEAILTLGV